MDDAWYAEQVKKVDDYIQVHNGVPPKIVDAYHHGVRGLLCGYAAKILNLKDELNILVKKSSETAQENKKLKEENKKLLQQVIELGGE